ncbi:MAG: DUF4215 domain-containing protein [Candidatus Paceibacterota bacterium]
MKLNVKKFRAIPLLVFLMFISGIFTINAEKDISSVSWPILVNLSHMEFGDASVGEKLEKTFTVSYAGKGDGEYLIQEKYKPKPGATVPSEFHGTISDYCQINYNDFDRCYRDLCPFIEEVSREGENDTVTKSFVGADDTSDVWAVILNTPLIGEINQESGGGLVSTGGEYGCDLSFQVKSISSEPVCGNGMAEGREECDDGNNKSGDGCSSSCVIDQCEANEEICDGMDNNCDGISDNVFEKITMGKVPDKATSDCGSDITAKVAQKDDGQCGYQAVSSTQYIYLNWNFTAPTDAIFDNANLKIKHREDGIKVSLEGWNGAGYIQICDLSENQNYSEEECNLSSLIAANGASTVKLRMKLTEPTQCHECLDWAYLELNYKRPISCNNCGNGKLEFNEECDDGNSVDDDSCSNTCTKNKLSISGCKYNDKNSNGKADRGEEKLSGWEIQLVNCPYAPLATGTSTFLGKSVININSASGIAEHCSVIASTSTGEDGCYEFTDLDSRDYGVNEVNKNYWTQVYPENEGCYYFNLSQNTENINFFNHQEKIPLSICGNGKIESGEECDDGNKTDNDGCSSSCKKETSVCGNGKTESGEACDDGNTNNGDGCSASCSTESGGGGGTIIPLKITNEKVQSVAETSAELTWFTNLKADSRVVCGKSSIARTDLESKPDYGYAFSTSTFNTATKVTSHNVSIYELEKDTTYYCRVISSKSSKEVISTELSFTTKKPSITITEIQQLYIYNLTLQGLQKTQVGLEWNTNQNGTTCVAYSKASKPLGEKPSYGYDWMTGGCEDLSTQNTSHSITITGLEPCTTYYFRLASTNGTLDAVTEEQQVKTLCQQKSTYYPRTYMPSTSITTEYEGCGIVESAQAEKTCTGDEEDEEKCEECAECEGTVKTVIEKERYMGYEDWFILFIILVILILIINALRGREDKEDNNIAADIDNNKNEDNI